MIYVPCVSVVDETAAIFQIQIQPIDWSTDLIVTGNAGQGIVDSAFLARTLLIMFAQRLGIDRVGIGYHIHCTNSEIAKDGPSAGLPLFIAMYQSCLMQNIQKKDIYATGELDLEGNVESVGGIKEKASGIFLDERDRQFIVPRNNYKDISNFYGSYAKIQPVNHVLDILRYIK